MLKTHFTSIIEKFFNPGNYKLSLFLAFKAIIKGNRWALVLLILVMAFSFVNLIFVSSLISGIMVTMDDQMVNFAFGNVVVGPLENKYYVEKAGRVEETISTVPEVAAVASRLDYSAFIEYQWKDKVSQQDKGKSGTWEVTGIDVTRELKVTTLHEQVVEGEYLEPSDRDKIVLGREIAGGAPKCVPAQRIGWRS